MTRCSALRARKQCGSAMVEYALVLPLYLCLFIGIVNACLVMYMWNCTAYAARAATPLRGGARVHSKLRLHEYRFDEHCVQRGAGLRKHMRAGRRSFRTSTWTPNNSPGSTINVYVRFSFSTFIPLVRSQNLAVASSSQMTIIE